MLQKMENNFPDSGADSVHKLEPVSLPGHTRFIGHGQWCSSGAKAPFRRESELKLRAPKNQNCRGKLALQRLKPAFTAGVISEMTLDRPLPGPKSLGMMYL